MTIVAVTPDEATLEQITKQLNKLVEVIKITEMEKGKTVRREIVLVKIKADSTTRADILSLADTFRGKVVDVAADTVMVEVTGKYGKIQAFLEMVAPYGIAELVQSGSVALARGSKAITDKAKVS
jgi:acetolactate synthase-1/3 small subunit